MDYDTAFKTRNAIRNMMSFIYERDEEFLAEFLPEYEGSGAEITSITFSAYYIYIGVDAMKEHTINFNKVIKWIGDKGHANNFNEILKRISK